MNKLLHEYVYIVGGVSLGWILRSRIIGLQGIDIFLHSSCTILNSLQQWWGLVSLQPPGQNEWSSFGIFVNVMDEKWYLNVALICISPIMKMNTFHILRSIFLCFL